MQGEARLRVGEVDLQDALHALDPLGHRVAVHREDGGGLRDRRLRVEVGRERREQVARGLAAQRREELEGGGLEGVRLRPGEEELGEAQPVDVQEAAGLRAGRREAGGVHHGPAGTDREGDGRGARAVGGPEGLADIDETLLPELMKLTKDVFDLDSIISAAGELKYVGALKRAIAAEFRDPTTDWVKLLTRRVYDGSFTEKVRDQFTTLVGKASKQYLNEQVNDRLKTALGAPAFPPAPAAASADVITSEEAVVADLDRDTEIETTLEELEGYQIVKAIACSEVKPQRVVHRDAKSYLAILLDDNNRRPIARLHFNGKKQKYLGLFDAHKVETRHPIGSLDEIYAHADTIREAIRVHAGDAVGA